MRNASCRFWFWRAARSLDVDQAIGARTARHLASCTACRSRLQRHRLVAERLRQRAPAPALSPLSTTTRIMAALRNQGPRPRPQPGQSLLINAGVGVALAALAFAWHFGSTSTEPPAAAVDFAPSRAAAREWTLLRDDAQAFAAFVQTRFVPAPLPHPPSLAHLPELPALACVILEDALTRELRFLYGAWLPAAAKHESL